MNELLTLQILLEEFHEKLNLLKDIVMRDAQFPDAPSKIKVAIGMRRARPSACRVFSCIPRALP